MLIGAVELHSCKHLIQSDLHIVVFATVALDIKCFPPIQARPHSREEGEREREREREKM